MCRKRLFGWSWLDRALPPLLFVLAITPFVACTQSPPARAEKSSPLERAQDLVERLEAVEVGRASALTADPSPAISQAQEELGAYLRAHPNDASALITAARLGRLALMAEGTVLSPGKEPPDPTATYAPLHAHLDQALALEPNSAQAHYWKARLYGIRNPTISEGRMDYRVTDLDQAIHFARAAVRLAPENGAYREALALYLVEAEQPKEAANVMQQVAGGRHPISELLADWEMLPIPATAVFSRLDSESFAQQQLARGRFTGYPELRVRVYVVPTSAMDVEKFYSAHWPGFAFFPDEAEEIEGARVQVFAQHLRAERGSLKPTATASKIPAVPKAGLLLSVTEFRDLPPERREKTLAGVDLPPDLGNVFCYLFAVNCRSTK